MTKIRLSLASLILVLAAPATAIELTNRSKVSACDPNDLLCNMNRLHISYVAKQDHDRLVIRLNNNMLRPVVCDLATIDVNVEFLNTDLTRSNCE